jgi:DNA-binding beta-propeller fold protein YncE
MIRTFSLVLLCVSASLGLFAADTFKVTKTIPLAGNGFWDYLAADSEGRRLYVSHNTEVAVLDLDSEKVIGTITGLKGVHGIAVASDLGKGFITASGDGGVTIFDLKSLKTIGTAKTGQGPDGLAYEPVTHRVFSFNGRDKNATVIDGAKGTVLGNIALGGRPEFPVADGKGNIYANIEDTSEIVHIDAASMKVVARWPIKPCEGPSGLAIDKAGRRLFAVCDKVMAVVNPDTGKVVTTVAIGDGPDAAGWDPGLKLAFSSNGEGTLSVVKQESPDHYSIQQTLATAQGARTMTLDEKTHKIYLATAQFGPPPAATKQNPHPYPSVKPGTFKLLVVSK